jgi:hypothetical protein
MKDKKSKGINPDLEKFITELMKDARNDKEMKLLDKLRIVDRGLALEKIKQKISDDEWGSGFLTPGDEEETNDGDK